MGLKDKITGLFNHKKSEETHRDVYSQTYIAEQHKNKWTHEVIAGAAGFEAMKAYENHVRSTGQKPSHS